MTISQVILLSAILVLFRVVIYQKNKGWFIFFTSMVVIFWFQPAMPIRNLYYWFPVIGIGFSFITWLIITDSSDWYEKRNIFTFLSIFLILILINLIKYSKIDLLYKFFSTPKIWYILLFWALILLTAELIRRFQQNLISQSVVILLVIIILIILKTPSLTIKASQILRAFNNQSVHLANPLDLQWIGFSYLSFRIIHVLRDYQLGKKFSLDLRDFLNYLFFFPAYLAGPIDRIERLVPEIQNAQSQKSEDLSRGINRIMIGSAKKFIIADSLALMNLNEYSIGNIKISFWMWVLVVAYGFRIFFDFAGYTDIAIGMAKLIGISLPENFNKPYRSRNLIVFWNNWHITLTQWFRTYFFNPVNRFIKSQKINISQDIIIFGMQTSTMVLIGLWHGITPNFIMWGLWHGLGLFINNRWVNIIRPFSKLIDGKPFINESIRYISIFITFVYISLGWVWFALPSMKTSIIVFNKLFGG